MARTTNRLRWAREYLGLSLHDVSQHTGFEVTRLQELELGIRDPRHEEMEIISKLYKFSTGYLLGCEEPAHQAVTPIPRAKEGVAARDEKELRWFAQFLAAAGKVK